MSKEDSFAWQNSAPFDTSKVLREIGSDLAIPAKDPIHPIPNVEKTFVPEKRDFAGRCNSPSSGLSSPRKCRLPTLCRGCQACQALPVHNLDGDGDGEDANGEDIGAEHQVKPVPLLSLFPQCRNQSQADYLLTQDLRNDDDSDDELLKRVEVGV